MVNAKPAVYTIAFGFFGILLATIFYIMNSEGVLIDEFVSGSITINDVMAGTIIVFMLFGVIYSATR